MRKEMRPVWFFYMKNHALNPSVVTYEHDTRRLRHTLPTLVTTLDSIQFMEFVTHQHLPFYHPILMPGCIYFGSNLGCCSLSLFFFLAAHFGGVLYDAH